jgi:L-rhamnose-H+ transport protein
MTLGLWTSLGLILLGGALQGSFGVPMKHAPHWRHENIWLVFSFTGLVLFPWLWTLSTVGRVVEVYATAPLANLLTVVAFGAGWGIGAVLTGVGMHLLGIGLGLGIILGISASVGSLVPFLALEGGHLLSERGVKYLAGTAVMFTGIALVAAAGIAREKESAPGAPISRGSIRTGLIVCIASGLLSSMLNFSFAFGGQVMQAAARMGTSSLWISNVVIAPATTGGFLANLAYCVYHFRRQHSLPLFWKPRMAGHWVAGILMGAFWFGGLALYGVGQHGMGSHGAVLGWPIMMGALVIASNVAGVLTGEWNQTGRRTKGLLAGGCAVILAALAVLSGAQPGS